MLKDVQQTVKWLKERLQRTFFLSAFEDQLANDL